MNRLLVNRLVLSIIGHLYIRITFITEGVKAVTAGPTEDKEAKEEKQEQKARLGRLVQLNIGRVINWSGIVLL